MTMKRTKNFAEVIRAKLATDPALAQAVAVEAFNADLAMKVYEARTAAGLSQQQLAKLARTRPAAIARLEAADGNGHSLALLKRIAAALGKQLLIDFGTPRPRSPAARG